MCEDQTQKDIKNSRLDIGLPKYRYVYRYGTIGVSGSTLFVVDSVYIGQ